jgi:cytochrome c biogenesis protein CcmG/thiol:disulfide interchange protein DsbE
MNWTRAVVVTGAVALPLLALLGFGLKQAPTLREIPSPLPGRPAPPFELATFRPGDALERPEVGDTVRLADHRGEVVVLNFWASWCLACRGEHRPLSRTAEAYAGRGVRFYGVLYQDSPENGRDWVREMGGQSYPSLLDPKARTAIEYGLYGVPETFFIGKDGRVAYKHVGPVTEALLTQHIERLRAAPDESP